MYKSDSEYFISGVRIPDFDIITLDIERVLRSQMYERAELFMLQNSLLPDDVVMELGTGIGFISAWCAKLCGNKNVFSYECNLNLKPYIKALHQLNNVSPTVNYGMLSHFPQAKNFYLSPNFWASSPLDTISDSELTIVPSLSFTEQKNKINPTALVVDIEGGEYDFFLHANLDGIRLIVLELHTSMLGDSACVTKRIIENAGFKINEDFHYQCDFSEHLLYMRPL